ncbi:MAG: phosphoglucosamine mutase, partial [Candidatus Methanomethylophilaceae archaeon]|nr:phosphoglucosamine mutase [Candidatus Methanomethylophilaceae archaeon]
THAQESAIEDAYEKGVKSVGWGSVGRLREVAGAGEAYIAAIVSKVDADAIRGARLKVCLDCSNGAASRTSPLLLSMLGVRAVTMNASPDGMFPGHESEPTEENLKDLTKLVVDTGSDLGMAHDGDADRCIFVTGKGKYVPGDKSLAILSRQAVSKAPGSKAVTTVATSKVVEAAVSSAGGKTVYTAVGSPVVARRMMSEGAVVGGEENGGVIFADHQYCRDGAMAIARMLEAVALKGSLEDQVASLPRFYTVKAAMRCEDSAKKAVIDGIAGMHRGDKVDLTDGVRIDFDDGWVLMRPSGTEPKFRVFAESEDEDVACSLSERFLREAESVRDSLARRRA